MKHYDPDVAPDATAWLALDEQQRIALAEAYHRATRVKLPSRKAHATFHAIVENQIALGLEPVVRAMTRLAAQGLSRHDAVHAVASVLAEHLFEASNAKADDSAETTNARYNAAVERLDAASWRRDYG